MPRSLQGDPGWNRDPRGWGKKELIPNATPFQSVITQCPFAAFSVCVHTFSSLSCLCSHSVHLPLFCLCSYIFYPFTVYVHTVSICHFSMFIHFWLFNCLCSHSVHLPLFYVHTFSTLSLCSHSVHLPLFSLCLYIFGLSQSVFTQCPFATFSMFIRFHPFHICVHTVSICHLFYVHTFLSLSQSVFTRCPFATFSQSYSYGVHLLPFSVSG